MKPLLLCLTGILFWFSCTKSDTPTQVSPPASTAVLDSFYVYSPGPKEIILTSSKLHYDNLGRFTGITDSVTDSTVEHVDLRPGADTILFTYNGQDSVPATFSNLFSFNGYPVAVPDAGMMKYDDQSRVIVDSPSNPNYTAHYRYGDNYFVSNDPQISEVPDTAYSDGKNIVRWALSRGQDQYVFTYSSYANPIYFPKLKNSGGVVLLFNGPDIISQNLFIKRSENYSGDQTTYDYVWTLNSDGLVVSGVGTDESTGQAVQFYRFVYKK